MSYDPVTIAVACALFSAAVAGAILLLGAVRRRSVQPSPEQHSTVGAWQLAEYWRRCESALRLQCDAYQNAVALQGRAVERAERTSFQLNRLLNQRVANQRNWESKYRRIEHALNSIWPRVGHNYELTLVEQARACRDHFKLMQGMADQSQKDLIIARRASKIEGIDPTYLARLCDNLVDDRYLSENLRNEVRDLRRRLPF